MWTMLSNNDDPGACIYVDNFQPHSMWPGIFEDKADILVRPVVL